MNVTDYNNKCLCEPSVRSVCQHWMSAEDATWGRVTITVLSMLVSASVFAAYSVTTFYAGVTVAATKVVRGAFLFPTYEQWVTETTHPDPIIKVVEACYLYRHEEKLQLEEECYRMLQEIMRMPDFVKSITGSSLKGSCDPIYDKFSADDKTKMENIEQLENKGYDVKTIKDALLDKYADDRSRKEPKTAKWYAPR